jgi:hypothetical protein
MATTRVTKANLAELARGDFAGTVGRGFNE